MTAYYNEFDPYAAAWLRNLIVEGLIAPGDVDERSIVDVLPSDVQSYTQCHFFAGIGGWSLALRIAGWPDGRRAWTGSCPCQPFSCAGKQKAQEDERHLWPAWFNLIKSVKPAVLFGEQVAGAIAHGWLDDAFDDLEGQGYETAACVLPACSVGAPHKRDRLWFVADTLINGYEGRPWQSATSGTMENAYGGGLRRQGVCEEQPRGAEVISAGKIMADADNTGPQGRNGAELPECSGEQFAGPGGSPLAYSLQCPAEQSESQRLGRGLSETAGTTGRYACWDAEPAVGRVANGIPARAHKLRAYGNAIVPQVAAEFIKAYMDCRP